MLRPRFLLLFAPLMFCLFAQPTIAYSSYNATVDHDKVVCAYQLSGQYGLLPRVLYYILLIFAALGHSHIWRIAGALVYVSIYSVTAVVHAFILAITSRELLDLDTFGAWAILSTGCLAIAPIFNLSRRKLPNLQSSFVFWLCGSWVSFGTLLSLAAILRNYPTETAC